MTVLFQVRLLITLTIAFPFHGLVNSCPKDLYQTEGSIPPKCTLCTQCDVESGSENIMDCGKMKDTTCSCRKGFSPREDTSATCKCDEGSGLEKTEEGPVCRKCRDGFFTDNINSPCVKWQECLKSGVKTNGTSSSDAICMEKSDTIAAAFPTSPSVAILTQSSTMLKHHRISTLMSVLIPKVVTKGSESDINNPKKNHNNGIAGFVVFAVLLLLVLGFATCRMILSPCIQKYKKPLDKANKDSLCRKPVEESGKSSDSSLVKGNEGEP